MRAADTEVGDRELIVRIAGQARRLVYTAALGLFGVAALALVLGLEYWPASATDALETLSETISSGIVAAALAVSAGLGFAAFVLLRWNSRGRRGDRSAPRGSAALAVAFALFVLTMLVGSLLEVRAIRESYKERQIAQQVTVARLKVEKIDLWARERQMALEFLAASVAGVPLGLLETRPEFRQLVEVSLAQFLASAPERRAVGVFRADGRPLLSMGAFPPPVLSSLQPAISEALTRRGPAIGTLAAEGVGLPGVVLPFVVPLGNPPRASDAFVIVSLVDPMVSLLRDFAAWPTPSPTSEIVLLFREGDQLVHIISGKSSAVMPPLSMRIPVGEGRLLGELGVAHGRGAWNALDRTGKRVLGATYMGQQVPWVVIAKTDMSEVTAELAPQVRNIWAIALALILFDGVLTLALGALLRMTEVLERGGAPVAEGQATA